ncbi:unnamed protein product [Chrysoparadoxa australica]
MVEAEEQQAASIARRERAVEPIAEAVVFSLFAAVAEALIEDGVAQLVHASGHDPKEPMLLGSQEKMVKTLAEAAYYGVRSELVEGMVEEAVLEMIKSGEAAQVLDEAVKKKEEELMELAFLRASGEVADDMMLQCVSELALESEVIELVEDWHVREMQEKERVRLALVNGTADAVEVDTAEEADFGGEALTEEAAAMRLQQAWRGRRAVKAMRAAVARNYVKMYDPNEGCYYWYQCKSGLATWEKPSLVDTFFGSKR